MFDEHGAMPVGSPPRRRNERIASESTTRHPSNGEESERETTLCAAPMTAALHATNSEISGRCSVGVLARDGRFLFGRCIVGQSEQCAKSGITPSHGKVAIFTDPGSVPLTVILR